MPLNIIMLMLSEEIDGIGLGRTLIFLIVMYFVIKWAVRNGITEAYSIIKDDSKDDY